MIVDDMYGRSRRLWRNIDAPVFRQWCRRDEEYLLLRDETYLAWTDFVQKLSHYDDQITVVCFFVSVFSFRCYFLCIYARHNSQKETLINDNDDDDNKTGTNESKETHLQVFPLSSLSIPR